jgi:hypothetical protein
MQDGEKKRLFKEKRKLCNQMLIQQVDNIEKDLDQFVETDRILNRISNELRSVKTQMFSERVSLSISNRHMKEAS